MAYPQFGDSIAGELRGADRIAEATRAFIEKGADVIKVGASERAGLVETDPRRPELTEDEMRAAVAEAAKKGLYVAAHAHAREGVANAVRAGVRSIEHGTWVDDETLAEMKRRGTYFVPTLAVMSPLGDPKGNSADDVALQLRTLSMMGPLRDAVKKAHALGITIAAATDGSYADGDDTGRIRSRTRSRCFASSPECRRSSRSQRRRGTARGCSASSRAPGRFVPGSKPISSCTTVIRSPTTR